MPHRDRGCRPHRKDLSERVLPHCRIYTRRRGHIKQPGGSPYAAKRDTESALEAATHRSEHPPGEGERYRLDEAARLLLHRDRQSWRPALAPRRLGVMTEGGEQRSTSNTAASPGRPRSKWTASRVIGMVFASIGGLIGLALLVGGIAVLAAYAFGRDDDGYFTSDRQQLESATYAITTEDIDLGVEEAG